jgi:hypothetical protein
MSLQVALGRVGNEPGVYASVGSLIGEREKKCLAVGVWLGYELRRTIVVMSII